MRYVTAVVGSIFMFAATWFLAGLVLVWVLPAQWSQREVGIGAVGGSFAGVLGALVATAAATHTFRASLKIGAKRRSRVEA